MSELQRLPEGLIALLLHKSPSLTDKQLRVLLLAVERIEDVFTLSAEDIYALELDQTVTRSLWVLKQQLITIEQSDSDVGQQWQYCLQHHIGVLPISSENYPDLLKHIYDPPPVLYYRGNINLLHRPQLAIVGSRRSTQQGSKNAFEFAKVFAQSGFTVTSGLALGIDTVSHQGTLEVGGDTIAVLGTGVDVIYPWRNRALYQQIIEKGLIISELPLGSEARKGHFPRRNRIISGLSLGVLVVEAAVASGSLISARCALEQGREVFAIPGSIHSPTSRGCHALIREGAKLVETVDHVMEEFSAWLPEQFDANEPVKVAEIKPDIPIYLQTLLESMSFDPQPLEAVQLTTQLPLGELMASLVQLEIKGLIENISGRYQRLI